MAQYLEIITLTDEQENKLKDLAQPGCKELYIEKTGESGQALLDIFEQETAKYN